jgi:hypothetical protein
MKLVNTVSGATISVDDEVGEVLLADGGWAKSTTTAGKKALAAAEDRNEKARANSPQTALSSKVSTGDDGDQGDGDQGDGDNGDAGK